LLLLKSLPPPRPTLFPYTTLFRSQEVFLKIWTGRSSLKDINYFPSYLYTITRNHTFNVLKKIATEQRALSLLSRELSEIDTSSEDRKSTRLNSSHVKISYAVFCLK